jgi:hypothetical protein
MSLPQIVPHREKTPYISSGSEFSASLICSFWVALLNIWPPMHKSQSTFQKLFVFLETLKKDRKASEGFPFPEVQQNVDTRSIEDFGTAIA